MSAPADVDRFDVRIARTAQGVLAAFNEAGVLTAVDVHVARRLAAMAGDDTGEDVLLATALAVRAPRLGHVFVDLATIRETVAVDVDDPVDVGALPWPAAATWAARVARSAVVGPDRPLRLEGDALYLDRYWREEHQVARDLRRLAGPARVDDAVLARGLRRLFPGAGEDDDQRHAAAIAVARRLAVVAGGPGTGKTTTVARIVALLEEQAAALGTPPPLVALAAPTGKAAARLQQAVHDEAMTLDVDEAVRARLLRMTSSTLHRLLGWRPGSHSRFRHDGANHLPHDVVIVDETSMVSLSLMSRLTDAVRPDARLILVGDPGQLTSIEAGAVLGDVVGPMAGAGAAGGGGAAGTTDDAGIGESIAVLRRIHRFGGDIQRLADAVGRGDGDGAVAALDAGSTDILWLPVDVGEPDSLAALHPLREEAVRAATAVTEAALDGDALRALQRLTAFRILCAHRRGPYGVSTWMPRVASWVGGADPAFTARDAWFVGRPLLVTENDNAIRLYNGDTGVVVRDRATGRPVAAFERQGGVVTFAPSRLAAAETVYAMTIHKSQGSQFGTAAVILPDAASPLLTREVLYTAVTRASDRLVVAGTEEAVRRAVARPIARASALRERLRSANGEPGPR